jgi:hypothetical protein
LQFYHKEGEVATILRTGNKFQISKFKFQNAGDKFCRQRRDPAIQNFYKIGAGQISKCKGRNLEKII